jgi:hypothetical protein
MLITQFLSPSHFLLGYLEDYKMDPNAATPLLTFSVFNDYADSGDISLVRCDIINRGIQDDEGRKVVQSVSQIVASVLCRLPVLSAVLLYMNARLLLIHSTKCFACLHLNYSFRSWIIIKIRTTLLQSRPLTSDQMPLTLTISLAA